jgi:hypothetical protein
MWADLITLGGQLIVPLIEITINIVNNVNINEMINDPDSSYGKEYIFDDLFKMLNPWIPLDTSPTSKYLTNSVIISMLSLHV